MQNRLIFLIAIGAFLASATFAQEEAPPKPWTNETDFALVVTSGNTEATTLKFKNVFEYKWERSDFRFKTDGLRVEDTEFSRIARRENGQVIIEENNTKEATAEKYDAEVRYQWHQNERFKWFGDVKWTRDRFSGVDSRLSATAGVGHRWSDTEEKKFETNYGLQYNQESLSFEPAGYDDTYLALTAAYEYRRKVLANSMFEQNLELVYNMDDSDDYRAKLETAFSTILTDRLSLKIGVDARFDNQPGFEEVFFIDGLESIALQLDDLDLVYTTSLTLRF